MIKILLFLAVLGGAGLLGAFLWVDALVGRRLADRAPGGVSAVYSDVIQLDSGTDPEALELRLIRRRYQKVPHEPSVPGEYFRDLKSISFITRPFIDADGRRREAQRVSLPSDTKQTFFLEPQALSALGTGEIRADEQKRLSEFPEALKRAVLGIEDDRFFSHFGLDIIGIARAAYENLAAGRLVQGGSTITQQLAKNLFFSNERTFTRKLKEVLAAISLERRFPKDRILEMYLNEVYLGQEGAVAVHGMAAAARTFFGKDVAGLTLPESALLAGIIQAPSTYSPRRHPQRAKQRRNIVLTRMQELGFLTEAEFQEAANSPLEIYREPLHKRRAPHFIMSLQRTLSGVLDMQTATLEKLRVFTGIDPDLQWCAERSISTVLPVLEKNFPRLKRRKVPIEVGLVSIEPFSGKVKAWVGGRDFRKGQFDHVVQARRQIGSTIKPFLYLTALDGSLNDYRVATTLSILSDEPVTIDTATKKAWTPDNYDNQFRGDVTLRYALERSLNIPAVQIVQRVGVHAFSRTLESFGIAKNITPLPSLALGALDTTLLNLTGAFAALGNGGVWTEPRIYTAVVAGSGEVLAGTDPLERRVADEAAVFVLTDILQGAVARGTGTAVRRQGYKGPAAGKTGTTNEARDAWFVGYTPDLATGVWLGYDDNQIVGLTGGQLAAPIWGEYMKCVSQFRPPASFVPPPGVIFADVDPYSGLLYDEYCSSENKVREVFVKGTEPQETCGSDLYGGVDLYPETR